MSLDNLFSLQGKTALVTGASSGLGEHFAQVLANAGARIVVAARRVDKLEDLVSRIENAGGDAIAIAMDVASADSVNAAFEQLDAKIEKLDVVVNNAGINTPPTRFIDQEESAWSNVLDVNLKGAWRVGQHAAVRMKKQGSGVIVNTASIYGFGTGMLQADYNVSKVALNQLTKNMALELSRTGVRVNALCPGYFHSAINEKEFSTEMGQAYLKSLVPQRMGEYRELDGPLLLLTSDASSYMTGTSLVVDGGTLLNPV